MRRKLIITQKRDGKDTVNQLKKDQAPHDMTLLEGIARGEKAIKEGRSLTHKQAKERTARWLK